MPQNRCRAFNALSLTVVITVVVALCFQAWMLAKGRERALNLMSTRAANRAQATAHQVQSVLKQVDLLLLHVRDHVDAREISQGPNAVSARKAEEMRRFLRTEAAKVPQILLLHIISPQGNYVYSSNASVPIVNVADRRYFQTQRDATTDQLRISEPLFGRVSLRWGIYPSRRLTTPDGTFAGIVFAVIDTESLGSMMVAVDQQQWILSLYDQDQHLVARAPGGTCQIGAPAQDPRLDPWNPSIPRTFMGAGLGERSPHIWATQALQDLPLFTCTGFSKERALAQWRQDLHINLAVASLLIIGCIGVLALQHRNLQSIDAIRQLNDRAHLAATSMGMGIWEWEIATGSLIWDSEMLTLYGIQPDQFSGTESDWLMHLVPEDRPLLLSAQEKTLNEDAPFDVQLRTQLPSGEIRYLHATAVRRDEESPRLVGITWDTTAAHRAQRELQSSEIYFRTLFDAVPDAMAVLHEGEVVDANQHYRDLFKVSREARISPWDLTPEKQPDGSFSHDQGQRLMREALGGKLQRTSLQCQRTDGSVFDGEITMTLFRHNGKDLLIAIIRDLTAMRAMEEKLHQAQKLDALGQLAGGVAHDFNNMLSAILSAAEMLEETLADERQKLLARTILSASERAGQLTHKLLAFARKGKILSTPTNVHQILQEAVALLERTIDRKISISTRLAASNATVVGDPSQIQNALLNLGVNARDAMPHGGEITYATETLQIPSENTALENFRMEPGEYLHIAVSDKGCGIPQDHLSHIFDPFFTTKEVGKGTGLGLASVFGTMVAHRGAVTVESAPNVGSTFHLYLPLIQNTPEQRPTQAILLPRGSGRVLIIDDEDIVRTATAMLVESMGYRTLTEADAERAITYFRDHHGEIDAIILDLVMPKASGTEVAAVLREIDPQARIILASGFPRNTEVTKLLQSGIVGFLQKPFNRQELGEMLATACHPDSR